MSTWQRFLTIDRRILYILFAIVILFPQFVPVILPLEVSAMLRPAHEMIEAAQPGDILFISIETSAVMYAELMPIAFAVVQHAYSKGMRIATFGTEADAAMFAQEMWDLAPPDYEWGRDFINFGFVAGYEAAVSALSADFAAAAPVDFLGNQTQSLPIMRDLKTIEDVYMVVQITSGGLGALLWVRQVVLPYGIPLASAMSSSMVPSAVPYYEAGNIVALFNGLKGAAEYELLTNNPGRGIATMSSQSLGHVFVVALVLLGNLAHLMSRKPKG